MMPSRTINWLHLSDWHVGDDDEIHLWPNFRSSVERDIEAHSKRHGPIDLVLFTGDLVATGAEREFQLLENHLQRLWRVFEEHGSNPRLAVVPGNHDLTRPRLQDPEIVALRNWHNGIHVKREFWKSPDSYLRRSVETMFSNFQNWRSSTKIPLLESLPGLLPGDFFSTFENRGFRLGIVGLNSTFLQFEAGEFQRKLVLSVRQLNAIPNYIDWLESHHAAILMTHHPETWLSADAESEFRSEIAAPGRFQLQLSGHLHSPRFTQIREGGSDFRMLIGGVSFFGLERTHEGMIVERIHGYTFGQWTRKQYVVEERIWPRRLIKKEAGHRVLGADPSVDHHPDGSIDRDFRIPGYAPVVHSGPKVIQAIAGAFQIVIEAGGMPSPKFKWEMWLSDVGEASSSGETKLVRPLSPFTDAGFSPDSTKGQFLGIQGPPMPWDFAMHYYSVSRADVTAHAKIFDVMTGSMVPAREGDLVPLLSGGLPVLDPRGHILYERNTWLHEHVQPPHGCWKELNNGEQFDGVGSACLRVDNPEQLPKVASFRCVIENRVGSIVSREVPIKMLVCTLS